MNAYSSDVYNAAASKSGLVFCTEEFASDWKSIVGSENLVGWHVIFCECSANLGILHQNGLDGTASAKVKVRDV